MEGVYRSLKYFSIDLTNHISSLNTNENGRFNGKNIHYLMKVKEWPGDYRIKYWQYLRDIRVVKNEQQRAPLFCLSEESPSTSIFISDAIIQQSDTALVTLRTPRKRMIGLKLSHSFCTISHSRVPKFCYPDAVLTATPRQLCTACGQPHLQTVPAKSVACQAPDDYSYPPLGAFKSIQVNVSVLEKQHRVQSQKPQCVCCGGPAKNNVPGKSVTNDSCNQEPQDYGIPICKGNLCPCFTALEQKQHLFASSKHGSLQDSETMSSNTETCAPLSQQHIPSSPTMTPPQSLTSCTEACSQCCETKSLRSVTNSNKKEEYICKHHVSLEQHEHRDSHKSRHRPLVRKLKSDMNMKNIIKGEGSAKQLTLAPSAHQRDNTDRRTRQSGPNRVMQYPLPQRKRFRMKQKTPTRAMAIPVKTKAIKRSTLDSTHPTTSFHLNVSKSSLESQKTSPGNKQLPSKQRNLRARSEGNSRRFRRSNDSSAEKYRQRYPIMHQTSPRIRVASNSAITTEVSPLVSPKDLAPHANSLPLWKNIVQFFKKTFLPTSADPLETLYSRESQVDAPELLFLQGSKQNKLKFVEPGFRRSISDVGPNQLFKFGSININRLAPLGAKKTSHNEHSFSCQNSSSPDTKYELNKPDFPAIKQSLKFLQSKSTLSANSENIQTSLDTNKRQKCRKISACNDCVSMHNLNGIDNIKPISRLSSPSQNARRNAFVVPLNRSTGDSHQCATNKGAKERLSPRLAPRSHSAVMMTGVSPVMSSTLADRINRRGRQSSFRQQTCDYSQ